MSIEGVLKEGFVTTTADKPFLQDPFDTHLLSLQMSSQPKPPSNPVIFNPPDTALLPVQPTLSPDVGKTKQKLEQKYHH